MSGTFSKGDLPSKFNVILPSGKTASNWGISWSSVNTDWGNTEVAKLKFPDNSSFLKTVFDIPENE